MGQGPGAMTRRQGLRHPGPWSRRGDAKDKERPTPGGVPSERMGRRRRRPKWKRDLGTRD